jgi:hypothetical protein
MNLSQQIISIAIALGSYLATQREDIIKNFDLQVLRLQTCYRCFRPATGAVIMNSSFST